MASSRKSSRSSRRKSAGDLAERVARRLEGIVKASDHLVVGLSGGVDSVVLLDCMRRAARRRRFRLSAIHVNHQLSPNAAHWAAFCKQLSRNLRIPLTIQKVHVTAKGGTEAAARRARYEALARRRCDFIVLAHHRDDQVETFLLQLLRGAGVKGLAAMPLVRQGINGAGSPSILRPLLDVTRDEILAYARARGLKWIEDESNADPYFLRNYLRHEVLPLVARRFPAYRETVARSARHLAEASALLEEVAASDGANFLEGNALEVKPLRRLPDARARNLLRSFLGTHGVAMPGRERLAEALRQILAAKRDAQVSIELDGVTLRRHRDRLYVVPRPGRAFGGVSAWCGERLLAIPDLGGELEMIPATGSGISVRRLLQGAVTIRTRRGGERLQPDPRRPRRSLKNLLQEARLPPWVRARLPLMFCGDQLVWAAGIGVDSAFQAHAGEAAWTPRWRSF